MSAVPRSLLDRWWLCGLCVEFIESRSRPANWERRHRRRDYWTYFGVVTGTMEVGQGHWSGRLGPAEQVILNPSQPFTLAVEEDDTVIIQIDFRVLASNLASDPLPALGLPAVVKAQDTERWRVRCRHLGEATSVLFTTNMPGAVRSRPLADALIGDYLFDGFAASAFSATQLAAPPPWLSEVHHHIRTRFNRPENGLATLAKFTGFSTSHVRHEFRRVYGKTPMRYLLETRMAIASRHLDSERSMSIREIAMACGFRNQSHFTRVFAQFYGRTPTAWRNQTQPSTGDQR